MPWIVPYLIQALIAIAISAIAYLIAPKPKSQKPPHAADMENPTADASRPIPVVFGTIEVKGVNVLWFGEKTTTEIEVK